MEHWNHSLFLLINAGSHPSTATIQIAMFLAQWLIYSIPLLLVWLWVKGDRTERSAAINSALGVGLALAIGQIITMVWPHPRPFMIGLGHALLEHKPEASFPSDHATVFFTLGFGMMLSGLRKFGGFVLLSGALVGWSRVFLGVHFPMDIIGASLVALPSAWLVRQLLRQNQCGDRLLSLLESMYGKVFRISLVR
ncbi:undecaprenyl-diphosphatase [Paludibacterium denitrificans]|uniref:Phosphatase PAP2 family protein n=1 Tax=Paludibacterium denitrificans TaxID=2675226 RepID=A0A844G8J2_9NEIS|nr:undecaprenyl-diphosphatase [Paludibacterium denitrificans]MTD32643.1 phosphatase PAP2 family protein [Paludibacterium denitrificans]